MPTTVVDDCEIHYELIGHGSTVVLTPGGRLGGAAVRRTAEMLAARRTIRCPTLVFAGNDDLHPPEAAMAVHQLVEGSQLAPLPWSHEEWIDHLFGRVPGTVMDLYPRLVPAVLDFLAQAEADRTATSPRPRGGG